MQFRLGTLDSWPSQKGKLAQRIVSQVGLLLALNYILHGTMKIFDPFSSSVRLLHWSYRCSLGFLPRASQPQKVRWHPCHSYHSDKTFGTKMQTAIPKHTCIHASRCVQIRTLARGSFDCHETPKKKKTSHTGARGATTFTTLD